MRNCSCPQQRREKFLYQLQVCRPAKPGGEWLNPALLLFTITAIFHVVDSSRDTGQSRLKKNPGTDPLWQRSNCEANGWPRKVLPRRVAETGLRDHLRPEALGSTETGLPTPGQRPSASR